jgi:hypothetical protein
MDTDELILADRKKQEADPLIKAMLIVIHIRMAYITY